MTTLTHLASVATASLFSAVWQSGLLVLCVAILLRLLPGITAAARSLIWAAVFLLTIALPFAQLIYGRSSGGPATASFHIDERWAVGLALLWAVLSAVRAALLMRSAIRLHRIASHAAPLEPAPEIAALLASIKPEVTLCLSAEVDTPSVAGFLHRRILLPIGLFTRIAPVDLYQIVQHELEHLRRRDDWTNLLQKLALVVFPLHPTLLWVERRLCLERELACDDGVLEAHGGAERAYATCLVNLAEASMLHRGVSLALGAWQRRSELADRVYRILRRPTRQVQPVPRGALAALILSAMIGTALLAAKGPQLISFGAAPNLTSVATETSQQGHLVPAQRSPVRATVAKAVLAEPGLTRVNMSIPRRRVPRHRTGATGLRQYTRTSDVVLIEWQADQLRAPRVVAAAQSFHLTYAAVPTRTGWLFFQLYPPPFLKEKHHAGIN